MIASHSLLQILLAGLVSSAAVKRWANGGTATGPTDPNVAAGCDYWANNIASGDTCASLESYFGLTVAQLVSWNPSLSSTDCTLTVGYSYCVEAPAVATTKSTTTKATTATTSTTTKTTAVTTTTTAPYSPQQTGIISSCNKYYDVVADDSCAAIASTNGITLADFYTWNPAIGTDCAGLWTGYYVCVGISGSSSVTTTSTTKTATSTAATITATGPSPQQTGIISTCNKYHDVVEGDTCASIASANGITLANFYAWNPAVGTCSSLWLGYYVCVGVSGSTTTTTTKSTTTTTKTTTATTATATGPSPTQTGIASDCTAYYQAKSGDTCATIVTGYYSYLTVAEFEKLNPAVGSSCANLLAGYYYCVATANVEPEPGVISTCKAYHLVGSGDSCYSIEQQYGITAAQFTAWNSGVGSSCSSLWAGYYVCVGV
ncbi:LysM domain protein [Penicillium sp. IBT 16267x]|nr:LysM domain protein [Penicillium sp. IBT 16267x]